MVDAEEGVSALISSAGEASWSGVQTCGSLHGCPVCSAVVRERRAARVQQVSTGVLRGGGGVLFATFTIPHSRSDGLAELLDGLLASWRLLVGSRAFRGLGVQAWVRAFEVTDGDWHGWHPHLHVLAFWSRPAPAHAQRVLCDAWVSAVDRVMGRAVSPEWGVVVRPVVLRHGSADVGAYLAKVQDGYESFNGREITRLDSKFGRRSRLAPFQLAELAAGWGPPGGQRARAVARWREYLEATHGRRAIEWSRSDRSKAFLASLGLDCEPELPSVSVALVLSSWEWTAVVARHAEASVLAVLEREGVPRAREKIAICVRSYLRERALSARRALAS